MDFRQYASKEAGVYSASFQLDGISHMHRPCHRLTSSRNLLATSDTSKPPSFPRAAMETFSSDAGIRNWPDFIVPRYKNTMIYPRENASACALQSCPKAFPMVQYDHDVSPVPSFIPEVSMQQISNSRPLYEVGQGQALNEKLAKEWIHPFYCRRRGQSMAPIEGMTRTRDKYRVVYTEKQRAGLEKEFVESKFIASKRKAKLAEDLGLSERQVKIWFQNRRAKERRLTKRDEMRMDDGESNPPTNDAAEPFLTKPKQGMSSCLYATDGHVSGQSDSNTSNGRGYIGQKLRPHSTCQRLDEQTVPSLSLSPPAWDVSASNNILTTFDISPFGTMSAMDQGKRT